MSKTISNGGPAFPVHFSTAELQTGNVNSGMTLLAYFAGQALAGDMAAQNEYCGTLGVDAPQAVLEERASLCWRMAVAMIDTMPEEAK